MGSLPVDTEAFPVPRCGDGESTHPLKLFDLARKQNRFLYACAPMVRYSKLAFRQTVHDYGTDLCWTPMILAKEFNRSTFARDGVVQFGANSPEELSRASRLAAPFVNGVDLNCGCPQSWACAETLGAALMNQRELVRDMVVATRAGLRADGWDVEGAASVDSPRARSVSVKIRVHDDLRRTVDFIDTVVLGSDPSRPPQVDWLTIHPRTRSTPSTVPIRADALEFLVQKYAPRLPILLSGDVFDLDYLPFTPPAKDATLTSNDNLPRDAAAADAAPTAAPTPANTSLSGFMSARGLLANPAMFAGHPTCPWEALERFMHHAARAPLPFLLALHHVHEMCSPGMGPDKTALLSREERAQLNRIGSMVELIDFLDEKIEQHTGQVGGLRREF